MTVITLIASTFGVIGAFSLLPQGIKIWKRKSASDISFTTYIFMFMGTIVWIFYGINNESIPLVLSNSIGFVNVLVILVGGYRYGAKPSIPSFLKK